jgi:hypothetical protein
MLENKLPFTNALIFMGACHITLAPSEHFYNKTVTELHGRAVKLSGIHSSKHQFISHYQKTSTDPLPTNWYNCALQSELLTVSIAKYDTLRMQEKLTN